MLSKSVDKRLFIGVVATLLLVGVLWWFLGTDRGDDVVERRVEPPRLELVPAGDQEIVRARRRPPREERPVIEPPPVVVEEEAGWVTCEVDGLPSGSRGAVLYPGGVGGPVTTDGQSVRFRPPDGVTSGRILFDGYGAVPLTIQGQGCDGVLSFRGGPAVVTGIVKHADGRPAGKVGVQGCWNRVSTDVDGSYYLESRAPGPCRVRAFRKDGVFTVWSEDVEVVPSPGLDVVADLALPPYQTAGLGAEVNEDPAGIALVRVLPGGAAHEAGLVAGDVVVEIDGEPTTELSLREFVQRALGPEGTEVELVLAGEPERIIEVRRRTMAEDPGGP